MDADLKVEYLIDGTLVAGQPCILAGPKKCLKTSVLIDLGISLVTGGFFLGRLKVQRPASVAIMSGESGLATIRETINRICRAAEVDPYSLKDRLIIAGRTPKLDNPRTCKL